MKTQKHFDSWFIKCTQLAQKGRIKEAKGLLDQMSIELQLTDAEYEFLDSLIDSERPET